MGSILILIVGLTVIEYLGMRYVMYDSLAILQKAHDMYIKYTHI